MLTLSDSALCADARDHIAITSRPQPVENRQLQLFLFVFSCSLTFCTLSSSYHNTHLSVAAIEVFLWKEQVGQNTLCSLIYRLNNMKV